MKVNVSIQFRPQLGLIAVVGEGLVIMIDGQTRTSLDAMVYHDPSPPRVDVFASTLLGRDGFTHVRDAIRTGRIDRRSCLLPRSVEYLRCMQPTIDHLLTNMRT